MYSSPSGDRTAPVWAADIDLDPATAASNTSGCQAADYAGMPQGAIVLLQYGASCSLGTKFFGAQQFGASAIVFFDVAEPVVDQCGGDLDPVRVGDLRHGGRSGATASRRARRG